DLQISVLSGGNTLTNYTTTDSQPVPHRFDAAGTYIVTATATPSNGASQTGSITVKVIDYSFPESPVCWTGRERNWNITNGCSEIVLQSDARLKMYTSGLS